MVSAERARTNSSEVESPPIKIADIFPGQGFVPRNLLETARSLNGIEAAREVFENTTEILKNSFPGNTTFTEMILSKRSFDEEDLKQPEFAQPAMLTVSFAAVRALESMGGKFGKLEPIAVAGHSAGTVGALVRASVLSYDKGLVVARRRGEAMRDSVMGRDPGTMVAILSKNGEINESELREICEDEGVVLANINTPTNMIISGNGEGTQRVVEKVKKLGLRPLAFDIAAGYHNPFYMGRAVNNFRELIGDIDFKNPNIPVYLNSTGEAILSGEKIKLALPDEIALPVNWRLTIESLRNSGVEIFREFGGKVMTGWLKNQDPNLPAFAVDSRDKILDLKSLIAF